MKRLIIAKLAVAAGIAMLAPSTGSTQEIRIVHYGGQFGKALRDVFFDPVEKELGLKIRDMSRTDMAKVKAMVESGTIEWDIVNVNTLEVGRGEREGLWEPIDWTIVDPKTTGGMGPMKYGVPFVALATGLVYSTEKYPDPSKAPQSWADFWDTKKFAARRSLDNRVRYLLDAAAMADGVNPDKLYPLDIERAFNSLNKIRSSIAVWATPPVGAVQLIANGEVDMGFSVNNEIESARAKGVPVALQYNQALYLTNAWVVVKGTPNLKKAMEVIQAMSKPEYQARFAEATYMGPINPAALPLVPDKLRGSLPSSPENLKKEVVLDNAWWAANEAAMIERFTKWMTK
jgi:putative spermidine/putrescine transport system substrate-binding protein